MRRQPLRPPPPARAWAPARPGEGVEDRVRRVAEPLRKRGAPFDEPEPVDAGLEEAERVVVGQRKHLQRVVGPNGAVHELEDRPLGDASAGDVAGYLSDLADKFAARVGGEPPPVEEVAVMTVDLRLGVLGEHLPVAFVLFFGGLLAGRKHTFL